MTVMHRGRTLKERAPILLGIGLISAAVLLSLFNRYEMGSETWGYWAFARVFSETGEFIIPGRSPLYILYLQLFDWMGYPASVSVEYVVTISIVMAASALFFRRYLGTVLAVLAAALWIPFYQMAEPPVQNLGIACVLLAITVRRSRSSQASVPASYALLALAYMFRGMFIAFAVPFIAWDVWRMFRSRGETPLLQRIRPGPWWMLLLIPASLFVWFQVQQSDHKWNYATAATRNPGLADPKSVALNAFTTDFSLWYNSHPQIGPDGLPRSYEDEIHGGRTALGIMKAHPGLVARHLGDNLFNTGDVALMEMTFAGTVVKNRWQDSVPRPLFLLVANALLISLLWGAWKVAGDGTEKLLVVGTVAYLALLAFFGARFRYMTPEVPMLVMGGIWYGRRAGDVAAKLPAMPKPWFRWTTYLIGLVAALLAGSLLVREFSWPHALWQDLYVIGVVPAVIVAVGLVATAYWGPFSGVQRWSRLVGGLAVPTALLALSVSTPTWAEIARDTASDVRRGELRVLERGRPTYHDGVVMLRSTLREIEPLIRDCRGVVGYTHNFLAAFTDVPLDNIYDTGPIPHTGRYGDPGHDNLDWLRPDRVDCVYIPTGSGEKYLISYAEALTDLGATTYYIRHLGHVTVLRPRP